MTMKYKKLLCALGSVVATFFATQLINPTNSDIPRHLLSGKIILESLLAGHYPSDVLYTNAFSYTHPDFPFVNHHWFSAVIFYAAFQAGSWPLLHALFLLIFAISVYLSLEMAQRTVPIRNVVTAFVLLLPLLITRTEVRPEVFSYALTVLFISMLSHTRRLTTKHVVALVFLQLFWANVHIYFVLGLAIIALWGAQLHHTKPFISLKSKRHGTLLLASIVASLCTPHGVAGLLYPFRIFQNYGYEIVENKSVFFLWNWGMHDPVYLHIGVLAAVLFVTFLVRRGGTHWRLHLVSLVFSVWAVFGVRNIPLAALVSLPIMAAIVSHLEGHLATLLRTSRALSATILLLFSLIGMLFIHQSRWSQAEQAHLGAQDTSAADMFIAKYVKGAVFNNYDIGSYLEWIIYPTPVYVDNRPEAYPISFFEKSYKNMDSPSAFQKLDDTHHFSFIVFQYRDLTPWSQNFLRQKTADPDWVAVYANEQILVLVRNTKEHKSLINTYQIPREAFQFGP